MRSPMRRDDSGLSLVELMVTIVLMGTVSLFVGTTVSTSHTTLRISDDESRGVADVRNVVERLARDVRDSRSVICDGAVADPTCQNHLQLWVDADANYAQTASETVTWKLQPRAGTTQFDMLRAVTGGASTVQARTIVTNVAFTYDVQPGATAPAPGAAHTTVVNVNMTYDANQSTGSANRTVGFTARLRNVA